MESDYPVRWRREGFIPASWADQVGELGLSDRWGHITALDVLRADRVGREARVARRRAEAAQELAQLEAALAALPEESETSSSASPDDPVPGPDLR